MTNKKTFTATAERDGRFWYLSVEELDAATQARRLEQAEEMVRDLIAIKTGEPADSFDVKIVAQFDGRVGAQVNRAQRAKTYAAYTQAIAALSQRIAAADLVVAGLTVRDIGVVLAISHQRVAQLLAEEANHVSMTEDLDRLLAEAHMKVDWESVMTVPEDAKVSA